MDMPVTNRRSAARREERNGKSEPARIRSTRSSPELKSINLALQGGGAHGAFAWSVLDRLLEDKRIAFDGISATSAGAMTIRCLKARWKAASD